MPDRFPMPVGQAVLVGWVDVRAMSDTTAAAWVTTLPDAEQDRFRRYRRPLDAHQFLAGRLLARRWLSSATGTPLSAWRFTEGDHGRPEIATPITPLRFNLAHSGGVVACVLADGREVGVDLEDLHRRPLTADLWRRYCAPAEVADIEAQPSEARHRRFLTYWTLKEAYLKARGLGISVHLSDIAFSFAEPHPTISFLDSLAGTSRDWAFDIVALSDRHLLSVATAHPSSGPRPRVGVAFVPLDALAPND